ncbi:MAG TPA: ADP-ribosylglycohydrolase family protein [Steroidobacteraceae bacterium]|nr:ADP-ribosylglycohydrolase family protein [Steroidobacteraceae bacterium]
MSAPAPLPPLPLHNCYWVLPGQVLAGEHPGGPTPGRTKQRLERLLAAGIESFLDLTDPDEVPPYDMDLPYNIRYRRNAIQDHGLPSRRLLLQILDSVEESLSQGRPLYVHCRAGIGRTGLVMGCLLVERGLTGDEALRELNRLWQQCRRSKSWTYVPETDEQIEYIRSWRSREAKKPARSAASSSRPSAAPAGARVARTRASDLPAGARAARARASEATAPAPAARPRASEVPAASAAARPRASESPAASSAARPRASEVPAASTAARPRASEVPAASAAARSRASEVPAASPAARSRASGVPPASQAARPRASESLAASAAARSRASEPAPARPASTRAAAPTPQSRAGAPNVRETAASPRPSSEPPRRPAEPAPAAAVVARFTAPLGKAAPARAPASTPRAEADPLLEPETLSAARGLRERFVGTLIGLAVGDAVAAATQYRRPGTFTPVGDMLGGGPFDLPRGAWSDDTSMALCLAESLLTSNGFDAKDQVDRYTRWQQDGYLSSVGHCVGITASTARALAMSKWRRQVFAGSHDPKLLDPEPLSRTGAAVLFFFSSLEAALQHAADQARTTCQAPPVLDDCRTLGGALHAALSGQPKASIVAGLRFPSAAVGQKTTTATEVLQAAFWAFASTESFRDAVLRAANLGGNSDVVAAVCGQLAGAHYGLAAIPASWRNCLMQQDLIESYGDRLLTQALLSLGS